MRNPVKSFAKSVLDRYLLHRLDLYLGQKLNDLFPKEAARQLFYDVANFVVYNQLAGDYLEFGVYQGDSLVSMYQSLLFQWETYTKHAVQFNHKYDSSYWQNMRFIAFDSFAGLPATQSKDTPEHFSRSGIYSMPIERFWTNVKHKGVEASKVVTVPGWFGDTLTSDVAKKHKISRASIAFIDCDLYESAVPVFRFITDLIQDGTVIIIDDFFRYKGHPQKGIRRAFSEWLEKFPHIAVSELTRCSANRVVFVCHLAH
jgi:O-methyltransferase